MSELFQEELELEKKAGRGFGAIIIIIAMIAFFATVIGWAIYTNTQKLKPELATQLITKSLQERGPAKVTFHTGTLAPDAMDDPRGPQYLLLEKAGIVKNVRPKKGALTTQLTPAGEKLITSLGAVKKAEKDGTTAYTVPLATRKLVEINNITKQSAQVFLVTYTWQWVPNELGNKFDAAGELVKSFSPYERSQLIDKHGVDFFHVLPPKVSVVATKEDSGWSLSAQ